MRKLAAILVALSVALAPTVAPCAQPSVVVGEVVAQRGTAAVLRDEQRQPLFVGAAVHRGDRVVTDAAARVQIAFIDRSVLAVGPESEIVIDRYAPDASEPGVARVLSLVLGIVRAVANPNPGGEFDIRTRVALASVRATDWIVEAQPDRTAVFVLDGRVAVQGQAGGEVVLTPGEGTDVVTGAPPGAPKRWGDQRVADALTRTAVR